MFTEKEDSDVFANKISKCLPSEGGRIIRKYTEQWGNSSRIRCGEDSEVSLPVGSVDNRGQTC